VCGRFWTSPARRLTTSRSRRTAAGRRSAPAPTRMIARRRRPPRGRGRPNGRASLGGWWHRIVPAAARRIYASNSGNDPACARSRVIKVPPIRHAGSRICIDSSADFTVVPPWSLLGSLGRVSTAKRTPGGNPDPGRDGACRINHPDRVGSFSWPPTTGDLWGRVNGLPARSRRSSALGCLWISAAACRAVCVAAGAFLGIAERSAAKAGPTDPVSVNGFRRS